MLVEISTGFGVQTETVLEKIVLSLLVLQLRIGLLIHFNSHFGQLGCSPASNLGDF